MAPPPGQGPYPPGVWQQYGSPGRRPGGVSPAVLALSVVAGLLVVGLIVFVAIRVLSGSSATGRPVAASSASPSAAAAAATTVAPPSPSPSPQPSDTPSEGTTDPAPSETPGDAPSAANDNNGLAVDLSKGDCIEKLPRTASDPLFEVKKVACTVPHDAQVGTTFTPSLTSYPSDAELSKILNAECPTRLARVLRADTPALIWVGYFPLRLAFQNGDHSFKCVVFTKDGSQLTRSVILGF